MSSLKWMSVLGVAVLGMAWGPTVASADDVSVKTAPAVISTSIDQPAATVQTVGWRGRGGFGFYYGARPRYGGFYGGYYARPRYYYRPNYYRPYNRGYYWY